MVFSLNEALEALSIKTGQLRLATFVLVNQCGVMVEVRPAVHIAPHKYVNSLYDGLEDSDLLVFHEGLRPGSSLINSLMQRYAAFQSRLAEKAGWCYQPNKLKTICWNSFVFEQRFDESVLKVLERMLSEFESLEPPPASEIRKMLVGAITGLSCSGLHENQDIVGVEAVRSIELVEQIARNSNSSRICTIWGAAHSPRIVARLCADHGYKVQEVRYIDFNPA